MSKTFKGKLVVSGKKFGIVISRYNEFITKTLLESAVDTLVRHGASEEEIEVAWVPGAFEIPYAANKMATKGYDSVICLGAVIRGDTPHFDYISGEVTKGIAQVSIKTGVPVAYGLITADTLEQAIDRAGAKAGNKGRDAALSAIEMVNLFSEIDGRE